MILGNISATTPKDQYIQGLKDNSNIPAGQAGSPWTVDSAPLSPSTPSVNIGNTGTNLPSITPLSTARSTYLSSLDPSSDLTAAKTKYLDFLQSTDSGIAAKEGQGRGIPLELVRGEQAKLGKQAEITAKRLQGDVTLAQDNANLAQEKAKANLGFAQDDANLARNDAEKAQTVQASQEKFAQDNNITTPFYSIAGTVYRTSDNHPFSSEPEAFAAGVAKDFSNAPTLNGGGKATKFETVQIGTTKNPQHVRYGYDDNGNIVSAVDIATNKSILGNSTGKGIPPVITPKVTTPVTTKTTLAQEHNLIDQALSTVTGKAKGDPNGDNFVSPDDFNKAADKFVKDKKGTYADFYSKHKSFANPSDIKSGLIKGTNATKSPTTSNGISVGP